MEIVYYTCLNNDCERHRNIFVEGDPLHAGCERDRLYLEGQAKPARVPAWVWFALPAAVGAGLAAFMLYRRRTARPVNPAPETLREDTPRKTWSAANSNADERVGHAVPPPIS